MRIFVVGAAVLVVTLGVQRVARAVYRHRANQEWGVALAKRDDETRF